MLKTDIVFTKQAKIRKTDRNSTFLRVYPGSPREHCLFGATSSYEDSHNARVYVKILQNVNFGDYRMVEVIPTSTTNKPMSLADMERITKDKTKMLFFRHCSVMADQLFGNTYYMAEHRAIPVEILQVTDCGDFCFAEVLLKEDFENAVEQL